MVPAREKLRIVLDANVLFSGIISQRGCPAQILDLIANNEVTLIINDYIISEVETHLAKKSNSLNVIWFKNFINTSSVEKCSIPTRDQVFHNKNLVPRDFKDVPIILTALNTKADYLVSGDKDLNSHNETTVEIDKIIKVLTPKEFIDIYYERLL